MPAEKGDLVRLQVPIHQDVYEELKRIAAGFDRPVAWMTREILNDAIDTQNDCFKWAAMRLWGRITGNKREKLQKKQMPDCTGPEMVRIQLNVSVELMTRLEELARSKYRPVNNMASLLLVWTLDDEAWMMKFAQKVAALRIENLFNNAKRKKKAA